MKFWSFLLSTRSRDHLLFTVIYSRRCLDVVMRISESICCIIFPPNRCVCKHGFKLYTNEQSSFACLGSFNRGSLVKWHENKDLFKVCRDINKKIKRHRYSHVTSGHVSLKAMFYISGLCGGIADFHVPSENNIWKSDRIL